MPFIKWVGGKTQLMNKIVELLPNMKEVDGYYEPFLGGGSVFFNLKNYGYLENKNIYLSDINSELINCYRVVRNNTKELISLLDVLEKEHERDFNFYYIIRDWYNNTMKSCSEENSVKRASCFIYLNKACFNGEMRYNSNGKLNSPLGHKEKVKVYDLNELKKCSNMLLYKNISMCTRSFENIVDEIKNGKLKNCFIYMDPPYDNISNGNAKNFKGYDKDVFSARRFLKKVFNELDEIKCKIMLSNSPSPMIMEEFKNYNIHSVKAKRMINSDGEGRGEVDEVIITNYNVPKRQMMLFDY